MKTLYDLLGVRPEDDAGKLRDAFRKAAKAAHPDLHAGDPDAPKRFRQIVTAYSILRDAEQRATYDRLTAFERKQRRSKLTRNIISDAIAGAGLAVVLVGGYTLFAHVSETPVEAIKVVEVTGRVPVEVAAVQPTSPTDTTERDEPRDALARIEVPDVMIVPSAGVPEANSGAPGVGNSGPAQSSVGLDNEVARIFDTFNASIDSPDANAIIAPLKKNDRIEPLDRNKAQSGEVRFSHREKDGVPKSPLSGLVISDEKPDVKVPGKSRTVAKRLATNHAPYKQASLENRDTTACSQCSGSVPPLFGVGF